MVTLVNAAAFPSAQPHVSTDADILPRQDCTDDISRAPFDRVLLSDSPATTGDCMRLLQELQKGGRQVRFETFFKTFGDCTISWNGVSGISPRDVTYDDMVAPLAVIISRGSSDGTTFGGIEKYPLGELKQCTSIHVIGPSK